jgi:hypothetical protein
VPLLGGVVSVDGISLKFSAMRNLHIDRGGYCATLAQYSPIRKIPYKPVFPTCFGIKCLANTVRASR